MGVVAGSADRSGPSLGRGRERDPTRVARSGRDGNRVREREKNVGGMGGAVPRDRTRCGSPSLLARREKDRSEALGRGDGAITLLAAARTHGTHGDLGMGPVARPSVTAGLRGGMVRVGISGPRALRGRRRARQRCGGHVGGHGEERSDPASPGSHEVPEILRQESPLGGRNSTDRLAHGGARHAQPSGRSWVLKIGGAIVRSPRRVEAQVPRHHRET